MSASPGQEERAGRGVSLVIRREGEANQGPFTAATGQALCQGAATGGVQLHPEALDPSGGLTACLACGHPELYTQKDFPRGLGITIVVVAALAAPFTWYLSLLAAAALDWALFRLSPEVVTCYVCRSEHRGFPPTPSHPRFDREIEERLLYGKKAVMGRAMRPGGTADGPDPEH